jgi:mannose-6-phosphate isomerase-like protein (cupin superfamily)
MEYLQKSAGESHSFFDDAVIVNEYNFDNKTINDAEINITGRYPLSGYAVNDESLALVSVESGAGSITIIGSEARNIKAGDRMVIIPGEPYALTALGNLAIRYIATPAWTASQARVVES